MSEKPKIKFNTVICTKAGTHFGKKFEVGDVYPVLGWNNGVQVCYMDEHGDATAMICHSYMKKPPHTDEYELIYHETDWFDEDTPRFEEWHWKGEPNDTD